MFATDFKTKRRFITKDYAAWRKIEEPKVLAAWERAGSPRFDKHLSIEIHVGLNYRSDIVSREKGITDLLVKMIPGFPDDRYIDQAKIERSPGIAGARVLVMQIGPPLQMAEAA
jgi:hypothetical protein